MKTLAEQALEFIESHIKLGYTVYFTTSLKSTKVTPSTFKKWCFSKTPLFNLTQF